MDGEVVWLAEAERRAWRAFVGAYSRLHTALDAELLAAGSVSLGEYEVMSHLSEATGWELRMNELAARCALSPSGLTRRFDGMARRGWVERRKCADDRRGVLAALTEAGHERLQEAAPVHVASVRRHFIDVLSSAELEILAEVFGRVAISSDRLAPA
jgi:DNA-binding MarR family transcriptional regulator